MGGQFGFGFLLKSSLHYFHINGSKNKYKYLDNNGTTLQNTEDDHIETRQNEDFVSTGYTSLYEFSVNKYHTFQILLDYYFKEQGLAGPVGLLLNSVRNINHRILTHLEHKYSIKDNILLNSFITLHGEFANTKDPKQEFFLLNNENRNSIRTDLGFKPIFYFFKETLNLNLLIQYHYNHILLNKRNYALRSNVEISQQTQYIFLPWLGHLILIGKFQWLYDKTFIPNPNLINLDNQKLNINLVVPNITFRLGFYLLKIYQKIKHKKNNYTNKNGLELYSQISYGQRAPLLSERFGDSRYLLPSLNLKQENALNTEIGLVGNMYFKKSKITLTGHINYFYISTQNLILFINNAQSFSQAINIGKSLSQGFELAFSIKWNHYIFIKLSYDYTDAKDKSNIIIYQNKFLPYIPRFTFNVYQEYGIQLVKGIIDISWEGSSYRDRANQENSFIQERFFLHLGVVFTWSNKGRYEFTFLVKNVLNNMTTDILNYPIPGREFSVKFSSLF